MKLPLFLARRYAQPAQNAAAGRLFSFASSVAFVSVMLGSMALILALAILGGFERELRENVVKFTAHIEITGFGKRVLPEYKRVLGLLRATPNVEQASTFIASEAIARSATFMDGVQVRGIQSPSDMSGIRRTMTAGAFAFSSQAAREAVIGGKLARKLNLSVGKKLTLYALTNDSLALTAPDKAAIIEQFRIVGIYETGMSEYDDLYVYIPFEAASQVFHIPSGSASGFHVLVRDLSQVKLTAARIEETLGYPFFVLTLFDLYSAMFAWIELQKEPVPIVLGLISIVAVFNIVATLFMAVVQKTSSIGVLRALGMKRRAIASIFLLQGLAIGTAGTLAGCGLGAVLCWLQHTYHIIALKGEIYFINAVPIEFAAWHYALVIGASVACSALAALIPAFVGARIPVLRALKFQ
jgi:lipoprotein-releasing system permease protein